MPSLLRSAAAFALAGAAIANPLKRDDSCLAAVTGAAALGDANLRKEHCSSFIKTIVTPAAITVTTTVTDRPQPTGWENYKRDVTVCPNEVPNYASACDDAGYKSACSVFGVYGDTTFTIPATTTTETVYGPSGCAATATETVTSTTTEQVATATVTVTVTPSGFPSSFSGFPFSSGFSGVCTSTATSGVCTSTATTTTTVTSVSGTPTGFPGNFPANGKCIDDAKAKEFTDAFTNLLANTNYNGTVGVVSNGYNANVSAKYLAEDFQDYSDSINWMAGIPLGSVTFDGRAAFDAGQSTQAQLVMETLFVSHSCNEITWRWRGTTLTQVAVTGINHFVLTDDLTQIKTNYAEFDNGVWINSFTGTCTVPRQGKRSLPMY